MRATPSQKRLGLIFVVIAALVVGAFFLLRKGPSSPQSFKLETVSSAVNRNWEFPATDRNAAAITTKLTFTLTNLEKTNQIYVKNKPIRTTPEKRFLVVSLELKNDTDKRVYFYSSDYVRLVSGDGKKFEADFKNPRFEVAPFSTKKDKLAFLVSNEGTTFELQIGEVAGTKDTIPVKFE